MKEISSQGHRIETKTLYFIPILFPPAANQFCRSTLSISLLRQAIDEVQVNQ